MNLIKTIVKKYVNGLRTKETIETYNELVVEANTQLGILRLDESFRKYEYKIKDVIKENLSTIYGEDPEKVYKNSILKMYNQIRGIDPFLIKDGSEPEIRESDIYSTDLKLFKVPQMVLEDEENKQIKFEKFTKEIDSKLESGSLNQEERKKLMVIKEMSIKMNNDATQSEGSSALDLFDGKSIEQLQTMDIQEIGKYEYKLNEEGQLETTSLFENNQIDKINKEMDVVVSRGKDFFEDLQPEKRFRQKMDQVYSQMRKDDTQRAERLLSALNKGEYVDDPIYIEILLTDNKFIKLREKFLKEYYSGKMKQDKETLLATYLQKGGDIIKQMEDDGIFYKYDTEAGKEVSRIFDQYFNELDDEEMEDLSKINDYNIQDEEHEEDPKPTLQSIIRDNMNSLKEGENVIRKMKEEIETDKQIEADLKYTPGRQKKNKKIIYKH